jgi:hypothetical protein
LEKALRRQLDADTVELDTRASFARYSYAEPREIDYGEIGDAAESASYTVAVVDLRIRGEVETERCERCDADVSVLVAEGTGQRLELDGEPPAGGGAVVEGRVLGFDTDHPRLHTHCTDDHH